MRSTVPSGTCKLRDDYLFTDCACWGMGGMTPEDLRGLTPLIYNHVNPYGLFLLNMNERLVVDGGAAA